MRFQVGSLVVHLSLRDITILALNVEVILINGEGLMPSVSRLAMELPWLVIQAMFGLGLSRKTLEATVLVMAG